MRLNPCIASMPSGYLFAQVARRIQNYSSSHPGSEIIKLSIGDVTHPLSPYVAGEMARAAAAMATKEGFHGYAPDYGYRFLIDAVIARDYAPLGVALSPEEVFISDGAKPDVGNLQELFAQDQIIAVTDPVYPVYVDSNAMAGRAGRYKNGLWDRILYLPCTAENGFMPDLPKEHADVLYLCYPNNPTGTVLTRSQLKVFVDWALREKALIVYDAAYKAFITTEDVPHSIYEIDGARECAIECSSFSKTAGFTGVRCAYMVIPKELKGEADGALVSLNRLWQRRTSTKSNGVSYPVQCAAAAVLTDRGQQEIAEALNIYRQNALTMLHGMQQAGLNAYGGTDSPYVWVRTPKGILSWDFFDLLLEKAQVACTPGEGFGPSGEGYIRLTAFNTPENTSRAIRRITEIL